LANNQGTTYRCAGYFYAYSECPISDPAFGFSKTPFALFTPGKGGRVSFGYPNFNNVPLDALVSITGKPDPHSGPVCYPFALHIDGTGWMTGGGPWLGSDSIIKTNVVRIDTSTRNLLKNIKPVKFYFDTVNFGFLNLPSRQQFGFIAQNVENYFPNLVDSSFYPTQYDSAGTTVIHDSIRIKGLNYTSIIPLLVSVYQEHDSLIASIQNNFKGTQNGVWKDTGMIEWGTNPLLHNTTLPMVSAWADGSHEYSIYFTGQSLMNTSNPVDVGIGYSDTTANLRAKLDVMDSTFDGDGFNYVNQYAGRFYQTGSYGVDNGMDDMVGVKGLTDVDNTSNKSNNVGGDFYALNSTFNNVGGRCTASGSTGTNYGLQGVAKDAGNTIGVFGTSDGTSNSIGISGYAGGSTSNIGILGDAASGGGIVSYAGYFSGDLAYTGGLISISDSTVKQNIHPINNAQNILNAVHPKVYNFDTMQYGYMHLKGGTEYGVLAQDLQNVLPSAVKDVIQPAVYDDQNNVIHPALHLKGVDYIEFIPLLIQAYKNLDSTNQSLQAQLTALQNCCNQNQNQSSLSPRNNGGSGNGDGEKKLGNPNVHAIELNSASGSPVLYQNIPNPFNNIGGTKIRYFVPDNMNSPMIVFFDEFGSKLQTFAITETGMGELDVTASNLVSGIYSYSLFINGKVVDTKRMVFQK